MNLSTIMTVDPITLRPDSTLDEALLIMDEHDLRHLPVLDGDRVAGMISDRDLLEATGWLPSRINAARGPGEEYRRPTLAREIMRGPVTCLESDDTVVQAAVGMFDCGVGSLVIVDGGKLVGIVTETDLVKAYLEVCRRKDIEFASDPPVDKIMRGYPGTIDKDASLDTAIERCQSMGIRHLPVVRAGGWLIGMVSDRDLRRAVGAGRPGATPVDEIMSRQVYTVSPDMRLSEAAWSMVEHKVSSMPVVDDDCLVGIVTVTDVLDQCLETLREPETFVQG